ncbi:MAG: LytTR family DNA-binding domain-containing protein [Prevotella sp.]|nr:LytTR family DNA-binding domain-containing protein [Prevotella sp.]MDD6866792.1 LytTR family DNA-binding domain-containing protein [Prevotella sp.]
MFDRQLAQAYEAYNNDIALEIVRRYCERSGGIELQTYSSPRSGMQRIREWQPDVVLLDIEMSGTSGIELARQLPTSCCLIFTTAYAQYALEGFEVNAVDFLHKPFFYERFERAMQKARQWLRMHDLLRTSESAVRQLLLKSDYKTISVSIDTILYIESIDNYVKVHLADGTSMLSKIPLHIVEGQLPQEEFIRIHRSFLVARCRIARFSKTEIILEKDGKALPIGRKYMDNLKLLKLRK